MLPSRPKINLLLPRVIRPGASFEAEVLLDAKSELQLDELKATLTGSERVSTGESGAKLEVLAMYATLGKEITLPRGRSVYRCRFALPQDLPASYQGKRCTIDYMMQVHAAVPWWLDRKEQFVVKLQPPRGDEHSTIDDPGPSLHSSHPQGAASEEPQVEFSLNTTLLKPSDTLSGSLALFNVESNRYRRVTLSLVANEQLRNADGGALNAAEASRYSLRFDLRAPQEGAASSWRMKAPETLAPSFQSALCSLSWSFEVFVETWWGSDISLMVPLRVAAKDARLRKPSKQRAIPTVGSDRILTIWRAVAKEHELILADHALTKEVGEVAVNVSREHHANLGVFLTGRLSYPNLNLELDGGERKGLQRFVREGIDVGDERWGRRHYFAGRDPEQVASFFHALRDLKRYQLLDIDDELLVVATLDAGQSLARLSRFVAAVLVLARQIPAARKAIPPPLPMRDALEAWQRLARRLGAPLETARMAVRGRYQGFDVTIGTHWSTENVPLRTILVARTPSPIDEEHQLMWADGELQEGALQALPATARKRLERIVESALSLSVDRNLLALSDPAPQTCNEQLLSRLELLLGLAASLTHQQGPYR